MTKEFYVYFAAGAGALAISAASACALDEDTGGEGESAESELGGFMVKGPVAEAAVDVHELSDDVARTELAAQATTEGDGFFEVVLEEVDGPIEIAGTGGTYRDEATGEEVALDGHELRAFIENAQDGGVAAVTALTTIAAERAAEEAEDGLAEAIERADRETAQLFGLGGIDLRAEVPADLSIAAEARGDAAAYGAVLGGISQVVADEGEPAEEVLSLIDALAEDFASGEIDGQNAAGEALETASAIAPEEAMEGLDTAIENYLEGSENASDYGYEDYREDACERGPERPNC